MNPQQAYVLGECDYVMGYKPAKDMPTAYYTGYNDRKKEDDDEA